MADQPAPASAKPRPGEVGGGRDRQRQHKIREARPTEPDRIVEDQLAHLVRVPRHVEREDRAADDIEGETLEARHEVDPLPIAIGEIGGEGTGGGDHLRCQHVHHARRKGRRHLAPLAPPIVARAEEQAAPEHRAQHPVHGREPRVVLRVIDEDVADRIRALQEDVLAPEESLDDNLFLEGFGRKRRERVAAQRPGHHAPRQPAGGRGRNGLGQAERLHSTVSSGTALNLDLHGGIQPGSAGNRARATGDCRRASSTKTTRWP